MRIVAALALVAFACGDDDGDGSQYVAIDEIQTEYKTAYCTYLARCGMFPDQATCEGANLTANLFALDPNLVAAAKAGRVLYNGNAVYACLQVIANDTCDKTDEVGRVRPPGCRFFMQGTAHAGEACILDEECISQQCSGGSTGTQCVMGTCIGDTAPSFDPAPLGMPCNAIGGCIAGSYCDTNGFSVCVALEQAGGACTTSSECGYGLGCIGATGARTCAPLPTKDQPCPDGICRDDGLYCSTTTATCQQVGLPPTACTSSTQCSTYYPCDVTAGVCKQGPTLGQSCSSTNRCFSANTFCDTTNLMCAALRPDGGSCTSPLQCASDFCEVNSGLCARPPTCF